MKGTKEDNNLANGVLFFTLFILATFSLAIVAFAIQNIRGGWNDQKRFGSLTHGSSYIRPDLGTTTVWVENAVFILELCNILIDLANCSSPVLPFYFPEMDAVTRFLIGANLSTLPPRVTIAA